MEDSEKRLLAGDKDDSPNNTSSITPLHSPNTCSDFFVKYFWEGQSLKDDASIALTSDHDDDDVDDVGESCCGRLFSNRRFVGILIPFGFFQVRDNQHDMQRTTHPTPSIPDI